VVGGAVATLTASPEWGRDAQWEWTYGEECKESDAGCFGLVKTAEALARHYESVPHCTGRKSTITGPKMKRGMPDCNRPQRKTGRARMRA